MRREDSFFFFYRHRMGDTEMEGRRRWRRLGDVMKLTVKGMAKAGVWIEGLMTKLRLSEVVKAVNLEDVEGAGVAS